MDPELLSAGLSSVGQLFSGITSFFGDNRQAEAEEQASRQALMEAGVNSQIALQQGDRTAAKAATQAAANGGGLVGSSLGVIQDLSQQAMFNARSVIYRGQTQANSDMYAARVAKANATNSLISAGFGGSSSLIGGWAKNAQQQQLLSAMKGGSDYYGAAASGDDGTFGYGG